MCTINSVYEKEDGIAKLVRPWIANPLFSSSSLDTVLQQGEW